MRAERLKERWEDIDGVLHQQGLPYVPAIIRTELISRHHNDPLAGQFGIEKHVIRCQKILLGDAPSRRRELRQRV